MVKIEFKCCHLCGSSSRGTQSHHIIHRSQIKSLINCKLNQVDLCPSCHDYLHHNRNGFELDYALQLEFQNKLEMLFIKQAFTLEEIQEILQINWKAVYSLSKLLKIKRSKYTRNDIILACVGGEYPLARYERAKNKNKKAGGKYGT